MKNRKYYLCIVIGSILALQSVTRSQHHEISLNSSNSSLCWKLKPQADIQSDSVKIFIPGYNTENWVQAIVPGTAFASYVDAGLEMDPNYADNIFKSTS